MATISNNDIARAIYLVSKDKTPIEFQDINHKVAQFLNHRRLLSKSKDILERLEKIMNKENNRIVVNVSSVKKLEEKIKKELTSILKGRYRAKEAVLVEKLDTTLLGGVRIEMDDEVIDLTAKNKIRKLQEHLTRVI